MKKRLLLLTIILVNISIVGYTGSKEIKIVKDRVLKEILKTGCKDTEVSQVLETLKEDGTWPGIDYLNISNEGFEHRFHHGNILILAKAYHTKSSKYYKKKKVKTAIERALNHWVENDYICDNWWHNQIGTPHTMVTIMLLVGNELEKDLVDKLQPIIGRANINAKGARPGGDRIKIAGIQAKNCLFLGDDKKFNEIVRIIEGEIKSVEWTGAKYGYGFRKTVGGFSNRSSEGRGIQFDNSFHHRVDGVNNTLSYGLSYASAFAEWAVYVHGTKYAFSEEKLAQLTDYFLDGVCKTAVFGKYPDAGAKNRSISRKGALKPYSSALPEKLISVTGYRKEELQEIIDIRKHDKKPTLSHATFYWNSEHFTIQRPDWFSSVRMYSNRNYNMEKPYNSEGFYNHHRGDGTNHLSVTADEYIGLAPVMDYLKIPGTTVMQKPIMPEDKEIEVQKLGISDFTGAATDGIYGTVAFDFQSPHDPLVARKAWFFFDKEYVCLGTGISCKEDNLSVATTLNQCILKNDVIVSAKGKSTTLEKGERELKNVDWIFHNKVGYIFPEPAAIHLKNSSASGSWFRINRQTDSPKDTIESDVFTLWIDHGKRPSEESYQYIVSPACQIESLRENTAKNNIRILCNTPKIQAVYHKGLEICEAVFYQQGTLGINENLKICCANPCILIIKTKGNKITGITASDPSRKNSKITISVPQKIEKVGDNFMSIRNEQHQITSLIIDLPSGNYAGSSVSIKL